MESFLQLADEKKNQQLTIWGICKNNIKLLTNKRFNNEKLLLHKKSIIAYNNGWTTSLSDGTNIT